MRHVEEAHGAVDEVQSYSDKRVKRGQHQHGSQKLAREENAQSHCPLRLRLEHDPEKWKPVFRKDHAPTKKLERQSIQSETMAL